jgi:putative hemolysin
MLWFELLVVLLLVLANGFLAMSEFALVSSRTSRLRQLVAAGHGGAARALALIEDPSRFLSTVQIGITLIGIVAGAFSGATIGAVLGDRLDRVPAIAPYGATLGIAITAMGVTYLSVIIGELVPKRMALVHPELTAARVARPMQVLAKLAAPAVWLLRLSTDAVLRPLGLLDTREAVVSEDEVKTLVAEATQAGVFVPQERAMIEGVLRLADRSVRLIMTPRERIVWMDRHGSHESLLETCSDRSPAHLLVCDGSLDKPIGMVHTRDLVPVLLRGESVDLDRLRTPVLIVPDSTPILKLLERFRRERLHFAVVRHRQGITDGIVTLTDVLESIAGELPERGEELEPLVAQRGDGSWLVDGALPVTELQELLGVDSLVNETEYETVAGLVLFHLGRLPREGESLAVGPVRVEVVDMDGPRIDKLLVAVAE